MNRWTWVAVVAFIVVAFAGYITMTRSNEPPTGMNDGFEDFKVEEFEATDQDPGDAPDASGDTDVYDMTDTDDAATLPAPPLDEIDESTEQSEPMPVTDGDEDAGMTTEPDTEPAPLPPAEDEGSAP